MCDNHNHDHAHKEGECCGGHDHDHKEGECCGGHDHDHKEGECCGGHDHDHKEGECCGGHDHAHKEGECCGGHDHAHKEGECCHTHGHDHSHPHAEGTARSEEDTVKLLTYMLDHNRHHGEDLHEIFHGLEANGQPQAAHLVHEAMHQFNHGNDKLEEALKLLGGK